MLKKIYQTDFFLLSEQEFWHMYILLRKGKDFYYECAGRSTEKLPDAKGFYDYEHACFTLDGDVLSLNKRMRPSLIAYIQQTIKSKQETFRKEIEMATKTIFEKKVSQVTNELGELLKKKDHREAWTKAGELNSLLKKEEAKDLKPDLIEQLHTELRGYYYINGEIEKANKRLYAKGSKLIELAGL
ncbi:conjugal transfer protein [Streptococcus gordonii]|uniref:conjugal transfer protein n=1 Tax=Streptococcus gordonii TaxID=1302 RepID=UPI0022E79C31|nr:conjugal transfer protein [Streptococcus gordonii]